MINPKIMADIHPNNAAIAKGRASDLGDTSPILARYIARTNDIPKKTGAKKFILKIFLATIMVFFVDHQIKRPF